MGLPPLALGLLLGGPRIIRCLSPARSSRGGGSMRVLVTGHNGYIGSVMVPELLAAGHEVIGLDTFFFEDCTLGQDGDIVPAIRKDIRDLEIGSLRRLDAVIHLAALCNDPLGDLHAEWTYEINHRASIQLALLAREAGVS